MKILNNKKVAIVGQRVTCKSCGAELEIETSDSIRRIPEAGYVYKCEKMKFGGKDMLLITKESGTLFAVRCASCGETIGFFEYGNLGYADCCLVNPERYFINGSDGLYHVIDMALAVRNSIRNARCLAGDFVFDCDAHPDKSTVINGQPVPVYSYGRDTILDVVRVTEPQIDDAELKRWLNVYRPNPEEFRIIMNDKIKTVYHRNVRDWKSKWITSGSSADVF